MYHTGWKLYDWGVAIQLNVSYSAADPDYYKLYELLFPWFCGFVHWV